MKLRFNIITLVAVLLCSIAAQAQERNANRMVFHQGSNILKTYSVDEVDSICFDYVENKEVGIKVKILITIPLRWLSLSPTTVSIIWYRLFLPTRKKTSLSMCSLTIRLS